MGFRFYSWPHIIVISNNKYNYFLLMDLAFYARFFLLCHRPVSFSIETLIVMLAHRFRFQSKACLTLKFTFSDSPLPLAVWDKFCRQFLQKTFFFFKRYRYSLLSLFFLIHNCTMYTPFRLLSFMR